MKDLFERGKFHELDGLRAFAILLVVFTHVFQTIPHLSFIAWNTEWLTPLFNGWMGVDLFFVLSGFLVGGQIFRQMEERSFSFSQFYIRRSFRILPTYLLILLFSVIIYFFAPQLYHVLQNDSFSWRSLLKNIFLITDYFPANLGVGSWSLSIEEQFYWIAPCVFALIYPLSIKRKTTFILAVWTTALILRVLTYRHYGLGPETAIAVIQSKIYFPFHTRMDGLAAGILTFIAVRSVAGKELGLLPLIARYLGSVLFLIIFLTGALKGGWFETTIQYSLLSMSFAFVSWGLLVEDDKKQSFLCKLFSLKIWVPIARLSYTVYLIHLLVIRAIEICYPAADFFNLSLRAFLMFIGILMFSIPIFIFFENPIHQWSKRKMVN